MVYGRLSGFVDCLLCGDGKVKAESERKFFKAKELRQPTSVV